MKVDTSIDLDGTTDGWVIMCPACGVLHHLSPRFYFNDDFGRPSFMPPLRIMTPPDTDGGRSHVCHSIITNGVINFKADCTHAMRNKSIVLPELE
jgi:hypothetical protein